MSLENLDTVIGFVVVILLLSLVVTTIVQLVVWLVSLRGVNLAWALHKLLREFSGLDPAAARVLAVQLLQHPGLATFARRKITAIRKEELLDLIPDTIARIQKLPNPKISAAAKAALQSWSSDALTKVGKWFDPIMDRTSEIFTLWTRLITALAALAIAFALHIDSVEIIKELATNRELRTKLVASADTTLKTAAEITAATRTQGELAHRALQFVLQSPPAFTRKTATPAPPTLASREAGAQWIRENIADASLTAALDLYASKFQELAVAEVKRLHEQAQSLVNSKTARDLQFLAFERPPFWGYNGSHLLGTLLTGVLLSLGAPFWHTTLRNLVALRPLVAAKMDQQSATASKSAA
jgi:hypothetical protein